MAGIQWKDPNAQPIGQIGVDRACQTGQKDATLLPLAAAQLQQLKRWYRVLMSSSVRHWRRLVNEPLVADISRRKLRRTYYSPVSDVRPASVDRARCCLPLWA